MAENKLVSVVIPTYKRPNVLSRSIDSVLTQSYENIEIIVVDDNDPDSSYRIETENVMQLYDGNNKVHYIKHERNMNGSAARNTGFRASKGDYIMFLDDDDEFYPTKIEAQLHCLSNKDSIWGVCYTDYIRKDEHHRTIAVCGEKREGSLLKEVLARNLFVHAGSNLMIRRSVVEEINGFDETFLRNQDIEFLARILEKYKIAHVSEVGLIVNVHKIPQKHIDFPSITEHYLEVFKPLIDGLSPEDQLYVYKMINLQVFRFYLLKEKNIIKALDVIIENKISALVVFRYMCYMLNRKMTRKAYGFEL